MQSSNFQKNKKSKHESNFVENYQNKVQTRSIKLNKHEQQESAQSKPK